MGVLQQAGVEKLLLKTTMPTETGGARPQSKTDTETQQEADQRVRTKAREDGREWKKGEGGGGKKKKDSRAKKPRSERGALFKIEQKKERG